MIEVKKEGIVLEKIGMDFENESVLNPAVIMENGFIHLFYRAVHIKNYSTIGYCRLDSPLNVVERLDKPLLVPQFDYESHGMEDPRMVKIDVLYYLTYVAFDGVNALVALATSVDLVNFERKGIIVPKIQLTDFDRLTKDKKELNEKYMRYN